MPTDLQGAPADIRYKGNACQILSPHRRHLLGSEHHIRQFCHMSSTVMEVLGKAQEQAAFTEPAECVSWVTTCLPIPSYVPE